MSEIKKLKQENKRIKEAFRQFEERMEYNKHDLGELGEFVRLEYIIGHTQVLGRVVQDILEEPDEEMGLGGEKEEPLTERIKKDPWAVTKEYKKEIEKEKYEKIKAKNIKEAYDLIDEEVSDIYVEPEWPKEGDEYWYVDSKGDINKSYYYDRREERRRRMFGNFYQTASGARKYKEKWIKSKFWK